MANTAINHDPVATFPGSSTNTAVVKWSGTSGNALLDSGVIIDASNNVTGLNNVTATGYLHLTGDEKELRFYEGANYIAIAAPSGLGADYTFTLPLNDGSADEFLQTNGSGVLTWAAAAGTTINSNADNRVITGSGTANTLEGETGLTFSSGVLQVDSASTSVSSIVSIEVDASSSGDPTVRWREGSGNGDANNQQYEAWMDTDNGQFRFRSQNIDGSSQEGDVWTINDGTNNVNFNGNIVMGVAGKGIDFSVTADTTMGESSPGASMTSELLDDYEEGSWTPGLGDNSSGDGESQAYTSRAGTYTKIGRLVFVSCYMRPSSLGNLTGSQTARIYGLPFNVGADSTHGRPAVAVSGGSYDNLSAGYSVTGRFSGGASYLRLLVWDAAAGQTEMTVTEFSANGEIYFSGHYTT